MEKSIVVLDSLLEIQISPLDKSNLGFQKGEFSLHASKSNKEEPKKPIANNTSNKSENQGSKKQNQQLIKQQNQRHRRKYQGASTFRKPFALRDDPGRFLRFQRNKSPFKFCSFCA